MKQKRKDDTGRFMQAIAAFSAAPERITPLGRQLLVASGGLVESILSELDETVLRRHLLFKSNAGQELVLDVGERRLYGVLVVPPTLEADCGTLVGKQLSEEDCTAVHRALTAFCASASDVFVTSRLPQKTEKTDFTGLSVTTLRQYGSGSLETGLPQELVDVIEACRPQVLALAAAKDTEVVLLHGDKAQSSILAERLVKRAGRAGTDRGVTLWQAKGNEGRVLILAEADTFSVALLAGQAEGLSLFTGLSASISAK
jgi:hypothetical protein